METAISVNWIIRTINNIDDVWNEKPKEIKEFQGTESECLEECYKVFEELHGTKANYHCKGHQFVSCEENKQFGAVTYRKLLNRGGNVFMHVYPKS